MARQLLISTEVVDADNDNLPEMAAKVNANFGEVYELISDTAAIISADRDDSSVVANVDTQGVLRLATSSSSTGSSRYSVILRVGSRTIIIEGIGLTTAPIRVSDSAGTLTLATSGEYLGTPTTIGGVAVDDGDTVNAINGSMGALDLVDSVVDLYGDISYSVIRTPVAADSYGRFDYQVDLDGAEFGTTEFTDAMPVKSVTPVHSTVMATNHGNVEEGEPTSGIYRLTPVQGSVDMSWVQIG